MWQLLSQVCHANVKVLMANCKASASPSFLKIIYEQFQNQCTDWKILIKNENYFYQCIKSLASWMNFNHLSLVQKPQRAFSRQKTSKCFYSIFTMCSNLWNVAHDCNFQFIKNGTILTKAYWIVPIAYWLLIND